MARITKCPNLPKGKYWCGEMHQAKPIGCDLGRNLRLYRPHGKKGVWIIDSRYKPKHEDYMMKRTTRLRKIKTRGVKISDCP